jgi:hypothetical protein
MIRRGCAIVILIGLAGFFPAAGWSHGLTITQVQVTFARPGVVDITIDLDLTSLLASPESYYALSIDKPEVQQVTINRLLPGILLDLQLSSGSEPLAPLLQGFKLPALSRENFLDPTVDHFATLRFVATLPSGRTDPVWLHVPYGAHVDYPVAFTLGVPAAHVLTTSWLDDGTEDSEPFEWAKYAPAVAASPPAGATTNPPAIDVDGMSWPHQLAMYLRLGFRHIVPEGTDHILFVLGLFFLGVTWRKLLYQTTAFTIAHATTLFLSTYGIFSLPSRYVEPAIAFSIAFIALENVWSPKLGPGRLAVVFGFGLIHGLGFASSLSEVPFPRHGFIVALLGFNFGVDAGQLFIVSLAFLTVGWFRNRPWFRSRIAIPCSLLIAATGLFWGVQRIIFYATA